VKIWEEVARAYEASHPAIIREAARHQRRGGRKVMDLAAQKNRRFTICR
jgi:hypothetical protein